MAKILIVRLGAMGDILHALPAATAIRAALPNSTIGWLVEERWSELLTAQGRKANPNTVSPQKPVVNTVHTVDTRRWSSRQSFPFSTVIGVADTFRHPSIFDGSASSTADRKNRVQ